MKWRATFLVFSFLLTFVLAGNSQLVAVAMLHEFTGDDGSSPLAGVAHDGSRLFGTTYYRGRADAGTAYSLNSDGSGFSLMHEFAGDDGRGPIGTPVLSGSILFGATKNGGSDDEGTVFSVGVDSGRLELLHEFGGGEHDRGHPGTGLTLSDSTLLGVTSARGEDGEGTVFSLTMDGSAYHVFRELVGRDERGEPNTLVVDGSTIYGTTSDGGRGDSDAGTAFSLNADGTEFVLLHEFGGGDEDHDGESRASLTLNGSTLYGTTTRIGRKNAGTVFSLQIRSLLSWYPSQIARRY